MLGLHGYAGLLGLCLLAGCDSETFGVPGDDFGGVGGGFVSTSGVTVSSSQPECTPGSQQSCYSGTDETRDVGACREGIETCLPGGFGFGPCIGEVLPTTETCGNPEDEDCDGSSALCPFQVPIAGDGEQSGLAVALDQNDNVFAAGVLVGVATIGDVSLESAGLSDVLVVKVGSDGGTLWGKRFGGAGSEAGHAIATDPQGNVIVSGPFDAEVDFGGGVLTSPGAGGMFLAKLDPQGEHLFSKAFGQSASCESQDLATDAGGNIVMVGMFTDSIDFGGGPIDSNGERDAFVVKLDPDGELLWARSFGDAAEQTAHGVALDAQGNVYVTGAYAGAIDLGRGGVSASGDSDMFVVKLDADGDPVWSFTGGGPDSQGAELIAVDGTGAVAIAGAFSGSVDMGSGALPGSEVDIFLSRFSAAGNHLWTRAVGDPSGQHNGGLVFDAAGTIVWTGTFEGVIGFGGASLTASSEDVFVALADPAGTGVFSVKFGEEGSQRCHDAAVDSTGRIVLTGNYSGTVDFGAGPMTTENSQDGFIAAIVPPR